jgi:uncharacterized protein YlxW (UPF0749 family)
VRINPFPFFSLILLVIFTLVFAMLTVMKSNTVKAHLEGNPEDAQFKSNPKLRDEVGQLQARIAAAREGAALRQREINKLDLQLATTRIHFDGERVIGGVSLPASDDLKDNPMTQVVGAKDTTWKLTSDLTVASVKRMEALKGKLESRDFQENPALDEAIRKRQQELQDTTKRISDDEAGFSKDREDLTKRLDELALTKDKAEKQHREEYGRRATGVAKLEDDIRKLLELELKWMNEIEADGQIIETAANQVVINIGSTDKVFPGLLFAVFNHERGRYVPKGMVETIEVRDRIAVCRILAQNDVKLYPIGKGDSIGNPVFDATHPKTFFVAGEFKHYNKADIEGFIRATGGVVAKELGPNCDYLVAGERSEREQASARQFQILALNEDTLLNFVQKSFAPKK